MLNQPAKVKVTLTASSPNPSPMGVFLFSFLCGGNCLGYAENTASNPSTILEANLNEGIYYLVVDKGVNAGNSDFTLTLNCENYPFQVSYDDFLTGDFGCPTNTVLPPHTVSLKSSPNYVSTDYLEFYFRDTNGQMKNNIESNQYWHNSAQPQNFPIRTDDQMIDQVKCSYFTGDTFYVFMHQAENNGTIKQFMPTFAPATGGGVTDSLKFRSGGFSFITKLTEINAINFAPGLPFINALPIAITRTLPFSSGEPWAVEKMNGPANWLSLNLTQSGGSETIELTFQENPSVHPRSVVLRFYTTQNPGLYQQFVLISQQGQCIIPQPVNILTANTNICAGTTITLNADVGANNVDLFNYEWSNGSTNSSITVTPSITTTYSVTVIKKECGKTSEDTQIITVTPTPNAPTPINASICQGHASPQAVSVVPQTGVQVFWYSQNTGGSSLLPNPANTYTPIPQPSVTTTYFAESVQNGCKSLNRTPVTLMVNPNPVFTSMDTICSANLLTYTIVTTISDGNTVTTTPVFPIIFNPANGTYTISNIPKGTNLNLTVNNTNTGCNNSRFVSSPSCLCSFVNAPATNSPQDYCPGETPPVLTAFVGNGEIAEWYLDQNSLNPISTGALFQPSSPGQYWVQARSNATQCVSPRVPVQVILLAQPTFVVLEKTCSPSLNNYTIQFNTNASSVVALPYTVTNLSGGNFEIAGIPVNQPVNIHLVDGLTNCQRDTLVPTAACGCPPNIPKPTTNTPLISICEGTSNAVSLTVNVLNGMSANWYRNGQLQLGSPNPTLLTNIPGDYWAKTLDPISQCESLDSTKVSFQYKPLPTLSLVDKTCDVSWQNYQVIVSSNTANLTAVPNILPGNNGNNTYIFVGIPIASTFTITATAANGCTQEINIDPPSCLCTVLPAAPQNPNNPSMCLGTTIPFLSVTVNNPVTETVDWYDASSGGNLLPNPNPIKTQFLPTSALATTDYFAQTRSIQNDCPSNTRTKVTLRVDQPATSYAGADGIICGNQVFPLSGSIGGSANSATWSAAPLGGSFSPGSGFIQAQTYTPPQNFQGGTVTISLTAFPSQPSVCPSTTDKMLLTVNPLPTITVLETACEPDLNFYGITFNTDADDIEFTPNNGVFNLNPDNSYTYGHIPEGTSVAITVKFVSTGCTYTITPPAQFCNCLNIVPKPIWLSDKKICEGSTQFPTLEVNVPAGFTVDWYNVQSGGIPIHTNDASFENPPGPDEYWAEAREINTPCVSVERTLVKLESAPNPIANAGPDLEECPGVGPITIAAVQTGVNDSYSWSNGQIGPSIQVPIQDATYILTVWLGDCVDYDTVSVSVLPGIESVNFDQTNISCNGGNNGSLRAIPVGGIAPFNYLWSNGNSGDIINGLFGGIYTVTVTNSQVCSITASAIISQPLPLVIANTIIQNATGFLNNGSILVETTGGTLPYQFQWLNLNNTPIGGQTDSLIDSIYGAAFYKVRVVDANDCILVSSPIFVDNILVSTDEPSLSAQIQVFPNPSTGKFYLHFKLLEIDEVRIETYDMMGRLLWQEQKQVAPGDLFELDLSNRPSGIYLLKIMVNREVLTLKLSLKK
ncbi:MAG: T9SS type A sorting domain-containing protein [Saprospiraceae bacterium]|nr:T9SS type A sorting domain-containing protein [Saprospiraceae bacterium]